MSRRDLPMRLLRTAMILIAVLCVAAATPLASQQAPDSARVVPASTAQASAPGPTLAGPRVSSPRFQRYEPTLARTDASAGSALAIEGGSHTIVISTLALVLIVIIIVLLVK
jgi:hypothetical protein